MLLLHSYAQIDLHPSFVLYFFGGNEQYSLFPSKNNYPVRAGLFCKLGLIE
jgi:hypothetical protein